GVIVSSQTVLIRQIIGIQVPAMLRHTDQDGIVCQHGVALYLIPQPSYTIISPVQEVEVEAKVIMANIQVSRIDNRKFRSKLIQHLPCCRNIDEIAGEQIVSTSRSCNLEGLALPLILEV